MLFATKRPSKKKREHGPTSDRNYVCACLRPLFVCAQAHVDVNQTLEYKINNNEQRRNQSQQKERQDQKFSRLHHSTTDRCREYPPKYNNYRYKKMLHRSVRKKSDRPWSMVVCSTWRVVALAHMEI